MKKKCEPPENAAGLRCQAETKLSGRKKKAASFPATEADTWRLVHELEVHQIELEMQNEELMQTRAEVEAFLHQYTDLYDFAPVGYFTLARDCTIHQVNLAGATLLGVERGKLIKQRFGVFVSARSRTTFNTFIEEVFGSRQKETCEIELRKAGSAPLWVRIEAVTEDGQECRFVVLDITERKQAEETAAEARAFAESIIATVHEPLLVLNSDLHVVTANRSFYEVFKVKQEETEGRLFYELGDHQWAISQLRELLENILPKNTEFNNFEVEHKFENIGHKTMMLNARKIYRETNRTHMILLAIEDITERKQIECELEKHRRHLELLVEERTAKLERSEMHYRSLTENSPDLIARFDRQYRHMYVNPTAAKAGRYSPEEYAGKTIMEVGISELEARKWEEHIRTVFETGKIVDVEDAFEAPDGLHYFNTKFVPEFAHDGTIHSVQSIARDITERKLAEDALHSTNERLRILHQITETVHESLELDKIFKRITSAVVKSMGFSTALVLMLDADGENFHVRSLTSSKMNLTEINKILGFPIKKLTVPVSKIIESARKIVATNHVIIANHLSEIVYPPFDKLFCDAFEKLGDNKSHILAPLVLEGKAIGGIFVSSLLEEVPKMDIDMLSTFASTAVQAIANAQMLSKTNDAKEQIHENLKEKEILLRELYHRTKNNMQVICSMIRIQASFLNDQNIKMIFYEMENKIQSMAMVHQKLYESKDLSHLNLKDYLTSLIDNIRQSYSELMDHISVQMDMEEIHILIDTAVPLGLVFYELISNIVKHAFPDKTGGKIKVSLYLTPKKELVLEVLDNGIGLPKGFDIKKGEHLGLKTVIDLVRYQLNGKIDFKSRNGLYCRILLKENLYKPRV
jgi:PAS domain S-box-containing protein